MLLATLALVTVLPAALPAAQPAPAAWNAAPVPCNPDSMKSIACNAQRHAPAPRRVASAPIACNPDPLKGAACHAHAEHARAEQRSNAGRSEELAAAD